MWEQVRIITYKYFVKKSFQINEPAINLFNELSGDNVCNYDANNYYTSILIQKKIVQKNAER